ncbi:MAG: acyl-CoA dehydratase activase [Candidatus Helarchaeota archaeon]
MYFAGIDAGSTYLKCIILKENEIIAKNINKVEGNPTEAAKQALKKALSSVGLKQKKLSKIVTTGRNRKKVSLKNEEQTEIVSISKGAFSLSSSVRTILDVGGFTNKAIKLNATGKVMDYVINDRCASGSGYFLELVSKALEIKISELSDMAKKSNNPLSITSNCSIFAESEVIYLVNEGKNEVDIAAGVCNSIASRLISILKKLNFEDDVVLTGGVAKIDQIKINLENRLGLKLKDLPVDPIFIAAYGAAQHAKEIL